MALDHESLWNKGKLLVARALEVRQEHEEGDFFLWMSLALELLGKAHLARFHPALVADTRTSDTLLAVCAGVSTNKMHTIAASEVFLRCQRTIGGFDKTAFEFCISLANDRNAHLHSGELPFARPRADLWISQCWSVVEILVVAQGRTLAELVGEDEADSLGRIIADHKQLLSERIKRRIAICRSRFESLPPDVAAARKARSGPRDRVSGDEYTDAMECPVCACAGELSGTIVDREDVGAADEDEPWMRSINCTVEVWQFACRGCGLEVNGAAELDVAGIASECEVTLVEEEDMEEPYMDE
jgi:hypothetical protein